MTNLKQNSHFEQFSDIRFDKECQTYLVSSIGYAKAEEESVVRPAHIVLAILKSTYQNSVISTLDEMNVDIPLLIEWVSKVKGNSTPKEKIQFSES